MVGKMGELTGIKEQPVIRDKAFAKRLEEACYQNKSCPTEGRGKQKWLYDGLMERFGTSVSPEAARKWFSGESRPRPKIMKQIAILLDVDESWLSLGIVPDQTPVERQKRNATADGAVNYIAGLIQMAGGHIAFPEGNADAGQPDLYAILKGRQFPIEVKRLNVSSKGIDVNLPPTHENLVVILVADTRSQTQFELLRLPSSVIAEHGRSRGGYVQVSIEKHGSRYTVGDQFLPQILSFENLEGVIPEKVKARA